MQKHEADRTFPPSSWFARWHPLPARATGSKYGREGYGRDSQTDAFKVLRCSAHQPAARLVSHLCAAMTQPLAAGSKQEPGSEWPVRLVSASGIWALAVFRHRVDAVASATAIGKRLAHMIAKLQSGRISYLYFSCGVDRFAALADPAAVTKLYRNCR